MHFLGELDHPISLIFPLSNLFLIFFLICKCFTTWGWRKIWIIFFSLDDFPGVALVAGALVPLSGLVNFLILFLISFPFSETLYGLRPCKYFSPLEIYLIFITFLIFEGKISRVKIFVNPVREEFNKLVFSDPNRDDSGERTSIPAENKWCL